MNEYEYNIKVIEMKMINNVAVSIKELSPDQSL